MPLSLYLTTDQPAETACLIQLGSMDLFAIAVTNNGTEGARRYLFSVAAGDILFGMPADCNEYSYKILAVAIEEPTLIQLTALELDQNNKELNLATLVQRWSECLSSVLLDAGISMTPINTALINSWDTLRSNLLNLHVEFIQKLTQLDQQESNQKQIQLQERERLNRQVATQALEELTAVLASFHGEFLQEGDALLTAVGAVGRALGIPIYPPAQPERLTQMDDPLAAIARASHIRIRRVLLEDGWWSADCGPLLGYTKTENRPIALLPVANGKYELFDPQTRTRILVNKHTASLVSPSAHVFYRPFPNRVIKALELLQFSLADRAKDVFTILWTGIAATALGMLIPILSEAA